MTGLLLNTYLSLMYRLGRRIHLVRLTAQIIRIEEPARSHVRSAQTCSQRTTLRIDGRNLPIRIHYRTAVRSDRRARALLADRRARALLANRRTAALLAKRRAGLAHGSSSALRRHRRGRSRRRYRSACSLLADTSVRLA